MPNEMDSTCVRLQLDGSCVEAEISDVVLCFDVCLTQAQRQLLPELHVVDADGQELPSRLEIADAATGRVRGWVQVERLEPGVDINLTLIPGAGSRVLPNTKLTPLFDSSGDFYGTDCFRVEAWIHVEEARLEAVQTIAASWSFAERPETFATHDAGLVDGLATSGYFGAVFDGRYVYFAPQCNDDGRHGNALRLDTHGGFDDLSAWSAYDAGATSGMSTKGYYGAVYDGHYVYYVPRFDGVTQHSRVLRLDTTKEFADEGSWCAHDGGDPISCQGAAFDGRYIYFAPGMHQVDGSSGDVLRLDTEAEFDDDDSWIWYDASSTGGLDCRCYDGAIFDGRHVYFVPLTSGPVLRYNPDRDFEDAAAWEAFDSSSGTDFGACVGAIFDGCHIYFVPYAHGAVVRYNTSGDFTDPDSWSAHTPDHVDGLQCIGYDGATFDGRWVSFIPFWDGESTADGFHGHVLRYDTTAEFACNAAWQAADGSAWAPPNPGGFNGGAFDGRFVYMAPWRRNDESGDIRAHGQVLRLDTAAENASFQLRWVDCGHNGGLGGSVPGPALIVNCADGPVSAQSHAPIGAGWHHVAGTYSAEEGAELWIDGECVARQAPRGSMIPAGELSVGQLEQGSGRLLGKVEQLRIGSGRITQQAAQLAADNLRDPTRLLRLC
jgi:hypothetical protein